MYMGWLQIGGVEVANNDRAAAYALADGARWVSNCSPCRTVALSEVGKECYVSAKDDGAYWLDANRLESYLYYGTFLLDASGVYDSTRSAGIVDGYNSSWVLRTKRLHREIVLRMLILARDERGMAYGLELLDKLPDGACDGTTLAFYQTCACTCDTTDDCLGLCVRKWKREFRNVRIIQGASILSIKKMPGLNCGVVAEVEMVVAAADPTAYPVDADVELVVAT